MFCPPWRLGISFQLSALGRLVAAAVLVVSLAGCDIESMMAAPGQEAKVAPPPATVRIR